MVIDTGVKSRFGDPMSEAMGLKLRKRIGHGRMVADRHDGIPIPIPCVDQFKGRVDEIFGDLSLDDQIHDR